MLVLLGLKDLQDLLVILDQLDHLDLEALAFLGQMVNLALQELPALLALLEIEVPQDFLDRQVLLDHRVTEVSRDHKEAKDQLELLEIQVLQVHLDFQGLKVGLARLVHQVLMET